MKKIFFINLLLLMLTSCYERECNCSSFKTGTFTSEISINGKKIPVKFVRNQNLQIENFNGKTDTSSVRWINDCEFVTRKIHPKNIQEQKSFTVRIIATTMNTYTFEFSEIGKSKKMTAIATKK